MCDQEARNDKQMTSVPDQNGVLRRPEMANGRGECAAKEGVQI